MDRGFPIQLAVAAHLEGWSGRSGNVYTCYRAANWQLLGLTTGRGKNDQTNKPNRPIKEILGLPLTPRFREHLTQI